MKSAIPLVAIPLIFFGGPTLAQDGDGIALRPVMTEEKVAQLQNNVHGIWLSCIAFASDHGSSAEELGAFVGRMFAPGWPDNLSPAGFVRGMDYNWQGLDVQTEILEKSAESVTGRRTPFVTAEEFEQRWSRFGVSMDEYDVLVREAGRAIAEYHGLRYEERREGDWVVFTVSRQ